MTWFRELRRRRQAFGSYLAAIKLRDVERALFISIRKKRRRGGDHTLYYCDGGQLRKAAEWNQREAHRLGHGNPRPARQAKRRANLVAAKCLLECAEIAGPTAVCDLSIAKRLEIGQKIVDFRKQYVEIPSDD